MIWPVTMFRLVSERGEPGLYCGSDGLMLAGVMLLEWTNSGFRPRPMDELDKIFCAAYGSTTDINANSRDFGLRTVARALNENDLARAMIASLMLNLPDILGDGVARLTDYHDVLKFNDSEPRNRRGQWTTGSLGNPNLTPVQITIPFPIPGLPIPGTFGSPKPKDDDVSPIIPSINAVGHPDDGNTLTDAHIIANDNAPKACPDPSWEPSSIKRTRQQLLYQAQINKLPAGWHVLLNGVGYDGCRESDQMLLEAKFGRTFLLTLPENIRPIFKEYKGLMGQAYRQNYYSGGRHIEWHFSDADSTAYWTGEFNNAGFNNITAKFTPYDEDRNYNLIRHDAGASILRGS